MCVHGEQWLSDPLSTCSQCNSLLREPRKQTHLKTSTLEGWIILLRRSSGYKYRLSGQIKARLVILSPLSLEKSLELPQINAKHASRQNMIDSSEKR
jgi:hypothetical protein